MQCGAKAWQRSALRMFTPKWWDQLPAKGLKQLLAGSLWEAPHRRANWRRFGPAAVAGSGAASDGSRLQIWQDTSKGNLFV